MNLNEAKLILNESGYYLLETSTYVGFPFMRILWERILKEEDKNENKLETHSNDPSKWIDVDFYLGNLRIYRTNTGIRGEFDNGRKFTYKTIGQNKWNAADECAKFIISVVNGEISERKAKEKLNFKESTQSSFIEEMNEDYNFYRNRYNQMNRKRQKQSVIKKELNKWFNLLSQMDKVKSHHYEIKGNTIIEYTMAGVDAVWTFEINKNDINVVVSWPNRPEWQEIEPVEFEYTLDEYDDYKNDVKEFLTYTGKFH